MSLPIRFLPEARIEFDEAMDRYEAKRQGLGVDLIASVRDVLDRVAAHPEWSAADDLGVRKALVVRFPYAVIFREVPAEVLVIAVFHTSRDPAIWRSRI